MTSTPEEPTAADPGATGAPGATGPSPGPSLGASASAATGAGTGAGTGAPRDTTYADRPRVSRDEMLDFGRLRRTTGDAAKAGGVAGGLARHFDIDPVIVRVLFVVTSLFGIGILAYGALWLLVPGDTDDKATIGLDDSTRSIVVIIIGVLALAGLIGIFGGGPDFGGLVFFGIVAIGAVIFIKGREQRAARRATGVPAGTAYAVGGQPTYDPATGATYDATYGAPAATSGQEIPPEMRQQVPPGGYGPPPQGYRPPPPRAPNPRKRGPLLFGFTAALLLLLLGLLGVADVAGMDVPNSAYPALAVAVIGIMLIVGAWYGRAGGLIALGLLASLGLAGATGADNYEGERTAAPTTATAVQDDYEMGIGELVLDLSQVSDPENLDGRDISIDAGVGHVVIVLPSDIDSRVNASVDGPGNIRVNGVDFGGVETSKSWFNNTPGEGTVTIDAELGVGEIEVRTS